MPNDCLKTMADRRDAVFREIFGVTPVLPKPPAPECSKYPGLSPRDNVPMSDRMKVTLPGRVKAP